MPHPRQGVGHLPVLACQWWMSAFSRMSTPPKAAVITALRMRGSQCVLHCATAIQPSAPSRHGVDDERQPQGDAVIDHPRGAEQQDEQRRHRGEEHAARVMRGGSEA